MVARCSSPMKSPGKRTNKRKTVIHDNGGSLSPNPIARESIKFGAAMR
jgi:hypothetical protein